MPGSNKCVKPFFILLLLLGHFCVKGQQGPAGGSSLKTVVHSLNAFRDKMPVEKLYLQLDKPYYNSGDTLWFKSYLMTADFLIPSARSGLLYVELDDVGGKMVKRIMAPVTAGVSWGNIALLPDDIPEGSYTLRVYTSWMLNFGEDYVFKKNIYISAANGNSTLINTNFKLSDKGDKTNVQAGLRFTGLNGQTLGLRDMQLRVKNGKKTLFSNKAITGIDGTMDINFDLADKTAIKNLSIQVQNTAKGADTTTLTIPVTINRAENTDLQFMPEGGNLVAGIATKVGFKAISEDGKGINISGKVYNTRQQEVAQFQATHKGMGSFDFMPGANENYTAKVTLGGVIKTYPLPVVHASGTGLKVIPKGNDSLVVIVNTTVDLVTGTYYLIGQSRGVVCYAIHPDLSNGKWITHIAKSLFPTGISRFTLLTNTNIPLNERVVYINHNDNLDITIIPNKLNYTLRDSIALHMQVKDKDGKPVQGSFSLAVTDNDQVKADSLGSNILNSLLFTSDLKGAVENPDWYLESNAPERKAALDNLLLTQGWVGYDWKDIFSPVIQQAKYQAEKEFVVEGKLTNVFNKPLKRTKVTLIQKQPLVAMDTLTDNNGRFIFKNLFPVDSAFYLVQVKNKDGENRNFNIGIDVNELIPPMFQPPKIYPLPWYVNSDTTLLNNKHIKAAELQAEADYKGEGHLLKTVEIKAKKIIPSSHNLNGPGEADLIIDEKEMNAAKSMTLYEFLQHKFPNFYRVQKFGNFQYVLNGRLVAFVIDGIGVPTDSFQLPLPVEVYMDILTANDIKGIEFMINPKYALAYDPDITVKLIMMPDRKVPQYLEITTYSGHGAFLKKSPGRYTYKPIPFSLPVAFYRPRYTINNRNIAMGTNLRSTIHWEPNVITDTTGRAIVAFFSADKPAGYTIIIEGTDLNGNFGYRRQKVKVMQNTTTSK